MGALDGLLGIEQWAHMLIICDNESSTVQDTGRMSYVSDTIGYAHYRLKQWYIPLPSAISTNFESAAFRSRPSYYLSCNLWKWRWRRSSKL